MTTDGLITARSRFAHGATLARFEAAVRANGLRIVAGVDHAIAALEAGVSLDATTVLMVGDGRRPRQAKGPRWTQALRFVPRATFASMRKARAPEENHPATMPK